MAQVIEGGADAFTALMYQKQHAGTVGFLAEQSRKFTGLLSEVPAAFFKATDELYQRFEQSAAVRLARAAVRRVSNMWQMEGIAPLSTIGQLQNASIEMQRWIMAEPNVRKSFIRQECDGYSESYVTTEPLAVGEQHYDYRRVVNSIYIDQPDGDYAATTYNEDLNDGELELDMCEQIDIMETWSHVAAHIRRRLDDPTSRENNSM